MKSDKWFYALMFGTVILVGWVIFHSFSIDTTEPTDPRLGRVGIPNTILYKICDGTTLVYSNVGVVVNSPECEPKK